MKLSSIQKPTAWLPLVMSLAALAVVMVHVAFRGAAHELDEGAAAHTWQLLMAAQLPVIAFFAIKWLPKNPRGALVVLSMQLVAGLIAATPVYLWAL